jgi:hypothetical protein
MRLSTGDSMDIPLQIELKPKAIIEAVKKMKKKERDTFLEDLLAATSPEYISSIKEARADYKAGRVKAHAEVFAE